MESQEIEKVLEQQRIAAESQNKREDRNNAIQIASRISDIGISADDLVARAEIIYKFIRG